MRKRLLVAASIALAAAGLLAAAWAICDWPPPRLILAHGFPPAGGPTGRVRSVEGIELVELAPGYFRMGSHHLCDEGDLLGRLSAPLGIDLGKHPTHGGPECPPHWVEIDSPFWIARTEVTNEQYRRYHPGWWGSGLLARGPNQPAITGDPDLAVRFCAWLGERTGAVVRLPSEAEWEYACRAGSTGDYCFGDDPDRLAGWAVFRGNAEILSGGGWSERPLLSVVGSRSPNAWGLLDMHGNAWEWCRGRAGDPGDGRILRGGDCDSPPDRCRSSARSRPADTGGHWIGFRPVALFPAGEQPAPAHPHPRH